MNRSRLNKKGRTYDSSIKRPSTIDDMSLGSSSYHIVFSDFPFVVSSEYRSRRRSLSALVVGRANGRDCRGWVRRVVGMSTTGTGCGGCLERVLRGAMVRERDREIFQKERTLFITKSGLRTQFGNKLSNYDYDYEVTEDSHD